MRKGDNRMSEKCKRIARASRQDASRVRPPRGEGRTCTGGLGANQGTAREGASRRGGKWGSPFSNGAGCRCPKRCRVPLPKTVPKRVIGNKRYPTPKKTATAPAPGAGAVFPASAIGVDAGRAASATLLFFGCEVEKW